MQYYRLLLKGRVQGVGFRYFVYSGALDLGIKGFVSNTPEGHVAIECAGEGQAINEFISLCRQGPPAARIWGMEISDIPPRQWEGFVIKKV